MAVKPTDDESIPENGIYAAAAEFERIVHESIRDNSRVGYFAALYHGVTEMMIGFQRAPSGQGGVLGGMNGFFDDAIRMDKFVWLFANRYFEAYRDRSNLAANHPWKQHFDYCAKPDASILQILTSGANAHMNLDLAMTAQRVGTNDLATLKADFWRINTVLECQIANCQRQVMDKSPTLRLVNRVPKLTEWGVGKLIDWARKQAWENANTVAPATDGQLGSSVSDATTEEELIDAVGGWAKVIARPPLPLHLALKHLVARFETAPPKEITEHLLNAEIDDTDARRRLSLPPQY